jgi:hypothetical protein
MPVASHWTPAASGSPPPSKTPCWRWLKRPRWASSATPCSAATRSISPRTARCCMWPCVGTAAPGVLPSAPTWRASWTASAFLPMACVRVRSLGIRIRRSPMWSTSASAAPTWARACAPTRWRTSPSPRPGCTTCPTPTPGRCTACCTSSTPRARWWSFPARPSPPRKR